MKWFYKQQFDKVRNSQGYAIKIEARNLEGGETHWMNASPEQIEAIFEILGAEQ